MGRSGTVFCLTIRLPIDKKRDLDNIVTASQQSADAWDLPPLLLPSFLLMRPLALEPIHGKAQELELHFVPVIVLAPANLLVDRHGSVDDAPKDAFCCRGGNALLL